MSVVHRLEFTIEPFEEGRPGRHVTAPLEALRGRGYAVEFGPFGSACDVPTADVGLAVGLLVGAAFDHGATHVNVDVTRLDVTQPELTRPDVTGPDVTRRGGETP